MIVVDTSTIYKTKTNPHPKAKWSHLLSTLSGEEGHIELSRFANKLRLNPR